MVEQTLARFTKDMQALLGECLVDIIIHGSVVLGDFRAGQGDIDYLVLTSTDLDPDTNGRLFDQHDQYRTRTELLLYQLEGTFYPTHFLSELNGDFLGCYIGTTRKYWRPITSFQNSLMDLRIIHDHGRRMLGKLTQIYNPTEAELRAEQQKHLAGQMAMVRDPSEHVMDYWISIVHWCARTLYFIQKGSITSKGEGCRWGQSQNGLKEFKYLLAQAENCRHPCEATAVDDKTRIACKKLLCIVGDRLG